jgi:microcystin-dependent protein
MADVRLRDLNPAEFNYGVNVAGNLGVGTTSPNAKVEIRSDGSDSAGAEIRLQHANNNSNDIVSTVNFANNVGSVAMIQGGTTSGNTNGYISFHTDSGGTSAERMRILSDGKVGIATDSPSNLFHIKETTTANAYVYVENTTAGNAGIKLQNSQGQWTIVANDSLRFLDDDSGVERLTITSAGKVGIGTTSPAEILTLDSSSNTRILLKENGSNKGQITAGGSGLYIQNLAGDILFRNVAGNPTAIIKDSGLVGIGTTTPTAALTVGDGTGSESIEINKSTSGSATLNFLNAGSAKVYIQADANEHLRIATNNAVHMSILENGNVGIGHTSPTAKLHVDGDLIVTGTVDVGSSGFSVSSGFILPFGGGTAPSGWLECDGAAVSRSTYSDLFAIIGTIYGAGDGSTTFNLPDLQGRVIMGQGGNTANRTPTDLENIGDTFGSQTHTLTVNEMPPHNHSMTFQASSTNSFGNDLRNGDNDEYTTTVRLSTNKTGGGLAHNNIQPSIVINYLIKT